MLPGFRFFMATIVLAASLLIFGLGAAALLRATHEEVAAVPTLRTMPPPLRPQPAESAPPTLALLRVEIPVPPVEELPAAVETAAPVAETVAAAEALPAPAIEPASPADVSAMAPSSEVTPSPEPSPAITTPETAANPAEPEATTTATANPPETPVAVAAVPPPEAAPAPTPPVAEPASTSTPPAPAAEVAARTAPAETTADTTAPASAPVPPTPTATGGAPVAASPAPEPTRVVAVTATGCEILPTTPGQPIALPEAAQDAPAQNDKTARLDPAPTGTIPTPVARPRQKAETTKRRATARHRHHAPRTRVVRREVVRPQPQPDFFTLLFGGGVQQQPQPVPSNR
jgi:hypothetical protein